MALRFALLLWLLSPALVAAGEPRDVAFVARLDGTEQRYVLVEPNGYRAGEPTDLLVALHGHGSDRWQFINADRDEVRAARDAAARHKLLYLSPDYRAKTSWMGPAAEADLLQILDDLPKTHPVGRVFLCGGSMGGTSALTFAALHPERVHGVASMNGTANHLEYAGFQDAIAASFGGSKLERPLEYKNRSAEYWPERLTMPVGLATGGRDDVVPSASVERLARVLAAIGRPVRHVHRPDGGHATGYDDATAILDFAITQGRK